MNPFKIPDELLDDCLVFSVERNGSEIATSHGFFCGKECPNTIQLTDIVDISIGDTLVASDTKLRYYVEDVHILRMNAYPCDMMVKYSTESQRKSLHSERSNTVFNIGTINGNSVIGNESNVVFNVSGCLKDIESIIRALPENEMPLAQELLKTVKDTSNSTHPVLVEGSLSKFSDLLKKHTDLLTAVGSWCVQLLIGKEA